MQQNKPQRRLRWFAVRCDSEKSVVRVAIEIAGLGVGTMIPRIWQMVRRGEWMVAVEGGQMYAPYVLVCSNARGPWAEIKAIRGVVKILGCRDKDGDFKPISIPYAEIRRIRATQRAGERRKYEARYQKDQKVKVLSGPFAGFEGKFDMPVKDRVKIFLDIFGRETPLELAEDEVRAA